MKNYSTEGFGRNDSSAGPPKAPSLFILMKQRIWYHNTHTTISEINSLEIFSFKMIFWKNSTLVSQVSTSHDMNFLTTANLA